VGLHSSYETFRLIRQRKTFRKRKFLGNFDIINDLLKVFFERFSKFGKLRYARITKDPVTGHSRGTGFVCFFSEEESRRCLEEYDEFQKMSFMDPDSPNAVPLGKKKKGDKSGTSVLVPEPTKMESESPFYLDGRAIDISEALSRTEASQVASDRKVRKRSGDKRNMYLMREGVIFPDSDAAKNMTPSEVSRRQKSYSERKRLLSLNPNLFISKCRLSVRNLNLKVDDKLLRKVALLSVKEFWKEVASGSREGLEEEVMKEASEERYDPRDTKKTAVKQVRLFIQFLALSLTFSYCTTGKSFTKHRSH
jgi:nucleolar protein 4